MHFSGVVEPPLYENFLIIQVFILINGSSCRNVWSTFTGYVWAAGAGRAFLSGRGGCIAAALAELGVPGICVNPTGRYKNGIKIRILPKPSRRIDLNKTLSLIHI